MLSWWRRHQSQWLRETSRFIAYLDQFQYNVRYLQGHRTRTSKHRYQFWLAYISSDIQYSKHRNQEIASVWLCESFQSCNGKTQGAKYTLSGNTKPSYKVPLLANITHIKHIAREVERKNKCMISRRQLNSELPHI